jgi:hypothetical protein
VIPDTSVPVHRLISSMLAPLHIVASPSRAGHSGGTKWFGSDVGTDEFWFRFFQFGSDSNRENQKFLGCTGRAGGRLHCSSVPHTRFGRTSSIGRRRAVWRAAAIDPLPSCPPASIHGRAPSIHHRRALPRRSVAAVVAPWPGAQIQGQGAVDWAIGGADGNLVSSSRAYQH